MELSESVYVFEDGSSVYESSVSQEYSIQLKVKRESLLDRYQFVKDNGPILWLADKFQHKYFPSSVLFALQHTHLKNLNGDLFLFTDEPLTSPYQNLLYVQGQPDPIDRQVCYIKSYYIYYIIIMFYYLYKTIMII